MSAVFFEGIKNPQKAPQGTLPPQLSEAWSPLPFRSSSSCPSSSPSSTKCRQRPQPLQASSKVAGGHPNRKSGSRRMQITKRAQVWLFRRNQTPWCHPAQFAERTQPQLTRESQKLRRQQAKIAERTQVPALVAQRRTTYCSKA